MGLPGPDAGNGGKHLLLPPDYAGTIPDTGYYVHRASSNRQIIGARSLPVEGDVAAAKGRLTTIKVYPLNPTEDWTEPQWLDVTGKAQDTTPLQWETNLVFWEVLHQTVDSEPAYEGYRTNYGDLAALGIEKGRPFGPGPRMKSILEEAAQAANAQMRVQSFADRRPDRIVWDDRQWQWASLRFEDGDFDTADHVDLEAREKWFYQAIGASPAMFRRDTQAGSLYWLGVRDDTGSYLDGGPPIGSPCRPSSSDRSPSTTRHAFADPDRAGQGGVALAVRTEGRLGKRRRALLRPDTSRRRGRTMDPDAAG
jgi:hypothetical protein